jgi:transcriptional regulator GlxA family with amidase domain
MEGYVGTMDEEYYSLKELEALSTEARYRPGVMAALWPISLRQMERIFLQRFETTPENWLRAL